jgi:hypothetical protein
MLYVWKKPAQVTPQATTVVVTASAKPPVDEPVALYAPPPPPKLEELDAGANTSAPVAKTGSGAPAPGGLGPCGGTCTGTATGALTSALTGRAGSARSCYERALRTSESLSGSMMVRVQVGPSGQVCSASVEKDTLHSNEVAMCVLGRFRGQSLPAPSGGCVTVNIPLSFTPKQ